MKAFYVFKAKLKLSYPSATHFQYLSKIQVSLLWLPILGVETKTETQLPISYPEQLDRYADGQMLTDECKWAKEAKWAKISIWAQMSTDEQKWADEQTSVEIQ